MCPPTCAIAAVILLAGQCHTPVGLAMAFTTVPDRIRRGVNMQFIAAAGPPVQLTVSEYGMGSNHIKRMDAIAVQSENDSSNVDEEEGEEEHPLRGGAVWSLARWLLMSVLCTLAAGLAICFAKQISATYMALRAFCCLCVKRGDAAEKSDPPAGSIPKLVHDTSLRSNRVPREARGPPPTAESDPRVQTMGVESRARTKKPYRCRGAQVFPRLLRPPKQRQGSESRDDVISLLRASTEAPAVDSGSSQEEILFDARRNRP